MTLAQSMLFLLIGYCVTVAVELPVLYVGLHKRYSRSHRVTAGILLTAFTYPVVVLILPAIFTMLDIGSRAAFLTVAEIYAPLAEILFFRFIMNQKLLAKPDRDAFVIIAANLCSFLLGEAFLSQLIHDAVISIDGR